MPAFSKELEQGLHRALVLANERHHEYSTLEHLLLALTEDTEAVAVMEACGVDLEKLRRNLTDYIDNELTGLIMDETEDCNPRRVPAGYPACGDHVQSSGAMR